MIILIFSSENKFCVCGGPEKGRYVKPSSFSHSVCTEYKNLFNFSILRRFFSILKVFVCNRQYSNFFTKLSVFLLLSRSKLIRARPKSMISFCLKCSEIRFSTTFTVVCSLRFIFETHSIIAFSSADETGFLNWMKYCFEIFPF